MIRSMTGFARLPSGKDEKWTVEIRSLNHRYFEFFLKAPSSIYFLEGRIRDLCQQWLHRGKVSVVISSVDSPDDSQPVLSLDERVVEFYLGAARQLKKKYGFQDDVTLKDILGLPKLFSAEVKVEDPEKDWEELEKALLKSIKALIKNREVEGKKLAADILERLESIQKAGKRIEKLSQGSGRRTQKKLEARLSELLGDQEIDRDRLAREVAFLAERGDITEEIVRLRSHLDIFKTRLHESGEVGRELDFLCQEINREANTMGSKSQFFEISTDVIFIKKELEKIREQVQNIE